MNILFLTSEVDPYAKTGGLADVSAALPKALAERGHGVKIVMPLYSSINREKHGITPLLPSACVHMGSCEEWFSVHHAWLTDTVEVLFVEFNKYFDRTGIYHTPEGEFTDNAFRYVFFSRAALQVAKDIGFIPDIVHANDWQTGLAPYLVKRTDDPFYRDAKSVLTIHNMGYQGIYPANVLGYAGISRDDFHQWGFEDNGRINLLKGGINFADAVTTVSPTYAKEITGPVGSGGLHDFLIAKGDRLVGILNGIDTDQWNPATDPLIPFNYDSSKMAGKKKNKKALQERFGLTVNDKLPLFGFVGRFAAQKGLDLLRDALGPIMNDMTCQFVILGSGETYLEWFFAEIPLHYPGRLASHIGYSNELAHLIEAGSDFFVMPSLYEPCGLNQMYSLAYGTLPVVRNTGGLADTVDNYDEATGGGTGFMFNNIDARALYDTVGWAVSTWYDRPEHVKKMKKRAMQIDFSWDVSAERYTELYKRL